MGRGDIRAGRRARFRVSDLVQDHGTGGANRLLHAVLQAHTALVVSSGPAVSWTAGLLLRLVRKRGLSASELALEDAICSVEADCRSLENFDRIQLKPPKRPGLVMRILRALTLTQPAAAAARRSGRPDIERRQVPEWTSPSPKQIYELPRLTP